MSTFVVQATASGRPPEIAAFQERFGARLARVCRDLKRHGALSTQEEELIGLVLDTPDVGARALPVFLADKARQLGWSD
jgi:hypothetical protein